MSGIYEFSSKTLSGEALNLADFQGKVLLIVNTASKCGFTPQYEGLQELHEKYADKGLVVLGFPCNQFGSQEPGSLQDINQFCELNYGVSFPLSEKVEVKGDNAHPLFKYLTSKAKGVLGTESIKWNFTKFLVNKNGEVVDRYAPTTKPSDMTKDIEALL
ncbi:MAG: glutathione peroxidase [Limnobacter sp.]|nr:glutathione peroxidase [Limnobacter sp.]